MAKRRGIFVKTGELDTKKVNKMIDKKIAIHHQTKEKRIAQVAIAITADDGLILSLMDLVDGTTNGARVGLEVFPTLIDFFYEFIFQDITNSVRISLINWKDDTNVNAPTLAKLFEDTGAVRPFSPWKFSNKGSARTFTVLKDNVYSLSQDGVPNRVGRIRLFGKKLPNVVHFNDAGTFAAQSKVFLVVTSDSAISGPGFKMQGVFKYKNS